MQTDALFLDCPEYTDPHGTVRCGLPAEVEYRYAAGSSDGPLDSAKIRCPHGHWFNGPVESLLVAPPAVPSAPAQQNAGSRPA